ncbi:hypothetical protein [Myxococcus guangdongensis]|uniref:hypothetical protein n=1 Tax=Myxococcus guangdongensis TaxID=2906760 RepID=UPI0020A7C5EB|nr:hypothetical protein [Myxococcus guangdongensis]
MILVLGACRSPVPPAQAPAVVPRPEVGRTEHWVDAAVQGRGEGTREKPWSSLSDALGHPGTLTVHLAAGEYRGSFTLPEGVRLEGKGPATVLVAEGPETVVLRADGSEVESAGKAPSTALPSSSQEPPPREASQGQSLDEAAPGQGATRPLTDAMSVRPEEKGKAPSGEAPRRSAAGADQPLAFEEGVTLLRNLTIRGGAWGVQVTRGRQVSAQNVSFTGQHRGGVQVRAGRFDAESSRFEASVPETVGLVLEAPPADSVAPVSPRTASLRDVRFTGPFRRAVRVRGAEASARLDDVTVSGAVSALGMDGGHAEVRRSSAQAGTGAAFSVVEGTLVLQDVSVAGHELALSVVQSPRLEVRRFQSVGAERAGLAVVASRNVLLEDVVVRGSGSHGAFQLTGSQVDARRLHVEDAAEYGVLAVGGRLRLRGAIVSRVHSSDGITGDALHLRQVVADVEDVVVRGASGTCVLATQNARVMLRDADLERCGQAALLADTLATLDARGVEVRDSGRTTLAATGDGVLRVDVLRSRNSSQGFVGAECTGSTRIHLGRVDTEDSRGTEVPCVKRTVEPAPGPR